MVLDGKAEIIHGHDELLMSTLDFDVRIYNLGLIGHDLGEASRAVAEICGEVGKCGKVLLEVAGESAKPRGEATTKRKTKHNKNKKKQNHKYHTHEQDTSTLQNRISQTLCCMNW